MDLRRGFLPPVTTSAAAVQGGLPRGSGAVAPIAPCSPAHGSRPRDSCIPLSIRDTLSSDPPPLAASWASGKLCCTETWAWVRLEGLVCFFTMTFRIAPLGDSFLCCSFPLCWWLGCGQKLTVQAGTFALKTRKSASSRDQT